MRSRFLKHVRFLASMVLVVSSPIAFAYTDFSAFTPYTDPTRMHPGVVHDRLVDGARGRADKERELKSMQAANAYTPDTNLHEKSQIDDSFDRQNAEFFKKVKENTQNSRTVVN